MGPGRVLHSVGHGVTIYHDPATAAIPVVPPLALDSGRVSAIVVVMGPRRLSVFRGRPIKKRAAETEVVCATFPAVGATKEECHALPLRVLSGRLEQGQIPIYLPGSYLPVVVLPLLML